MSKDLRLIPGKSDHPPATEAQMAAIEFASIKRLARTPKKLREKNLHYIAKNAYTAALMAIELMAMDKTEVLKTARENPDLFGPEALNAFAEAHENARALLEVISSGEARLAITLASIETDSPRRERSRVCNAKSAGGAQGRRFCFLASAARLPRRSRAR
jgi:hypothetical protein